MSDLIDGMEIHTPETLDRLPIGTLARDKDGYWVVRISDTEWVAFEGRNPTPTYWGHDEVRGDYHDADSGDPQPFLPLHEIRLPH